MHMHDARMSTPVGTRAYLFLRITIQMESNNDFLFFLLCWFLHTRTCISLTNLRFICFDSSGKTKEIPFIAID